MLRRSVHIFGGNLHNFGGRIHNQSRKLSGVFHHQDAVASFGFDALDAKALAQVHDGDDFSAQVDYALEVVGSVGNGSDLRHPHDLVQGSDGDAVSFAPNLEADDMEFAIHRFALWSSVALPRWRGARVAAFLRPRARTIRIHRA